MGADPTRVRWRLSIPRLLRLLLIAGAIGCATAPAAAALPTEGVFENCPIADALTTCVGRLSAMSAAGLRVVVIQPGRTPLDELAQYAAAAHARGISVMWAIGLPGWWTEPLFGTAMLRQLPALSAACGCQDNGALFAYFVRWLKALPGTYGYYAADDTALDPGQEPEIESYMARLKELDPVHPRMIGWYAGYNVGAYESMADLLGQEIYPVTTGPLMPAADHGSAWNAVAAIASDAQSQASAAGKSSAFILQAFTWGDNLTDGIDIGACTPLDTIDSCYARVRYPSPEEQLALRNTVLNHAHPSLILWYSFPETYGSVTESRGTLYPTGDVAALRWQGLASVIRAPWTAPVARKPPTARKPGAPKRSCAVATPSRRRHRGRRRRGRFTHICKALA